MKSPKFGETLRAFRLAKNLTRDRLATRLAGKYACDSIMVGEWETGQRKPPPKDVVVLIAKALKLNREETNILLSSAGHELS